MSGFSLRHTLCRATASTPIGQGTKVLILSVEQNHLLLHVRFMPVRIRSLLLHRLLSTLLLFMELADSALAAPTLEELPYAFKTRTGPRERVALRCDVHWFVVCFSCLYVRGPSLVPEGAHLLEERGVVVAVLVDDVVRLSV